MSGGGADARDLAPLIGSWEVEADFGEGGPGTARGTCAFEPILDGRFVIHRSEMDDPVPDSTSLIAPNPDTSNYLQHYFDARGVVRLYAMTFVEREWSLLRVSPDFSPLAFSQRFRGTVSEDGETIEGAWEASDDGVNWRFDLNLAYRRATA